MQSFFALLYMLPLFLKVPAAQAALDVKTVPLILYAGIFSSVLLPCGSKACIGWARCSIFINLLPLFTAMAAFALLRELHGYHLLAAR